MANMGSSLNHATLPLSALATRYRFFHRFPLAFALYTHPVSSPPGAAAGPAATATGAAAASGSAPAAPSSSLLASPAPDAASTGTGSPSLLLIAMVHVVGGRPGPAARR